MPSINRSHDELAMIAAALRQVLIADELLGLIAARDGMDITTLSGADREALSDLAGDLDAVAREHAEAG